MAIQAQLFSENLGFALGNSQDLSVETACGFDNLCFASSQQQQLIQFDQQFQNQKSLSNIRFHHHHHHHHLLQQQQQQQQQQHLQSMTFSQTVSAHIDRQRLEFEQFVNLQNERLRIAMQEERKQQMAILVKKYEWKSEFLVKQKEEEIARAANRNVELENFMKRIEIENQTWQAVARENEAMIASLNSSIQRLRESAENAADDAESCCQNVEEEEEERERRKKKKKMICRCCNSRNSCVVMLPCRHLCSCKDCEVFLDSCPVCSMPKKATIEALI